MMVTMQTAAEPLQYWDGLALGLFLGAVLYWAYQRLTQMKYRVTCSNCEEDEVHYNRDRIADYCQTCGSELEISSEQSSLHNFAERKEHTGLDRGDEQ